MRPSPRNEAERLRRNESLMPSITAKFDNTEREFLIERLSDVPVAARQPSEAELLRKLRRCGGRQVRLHGWERAWIINRVSNSKIRKVTTSSILEKVR